MAVGWIRWDKSEAPAFERAGLLTAAAATAVVLAGWMRLVSNHAPLSLGGLALLCGAGGAMLILLCRVTMPGRLRAGLILALLVTMMTGAARAGLIGAQAMDARAPAESLHDSARRWRSALGLESEALRLGLAAGGARVTLRAASVGDGGWAERLDDTLDGHLGGAAAAGLTIDGEVSSTGGAVRMAWTVEDASATAGCGATSASGDPAMLADQLAAPLAQAIRRSLRLGRPACP